MAQFRFIHCQATLLLAMLKLGPFLLVLLLACTTQAAGIYQCRTKDGSMAFQSVPCNTAKPRVAKPSAQQAVAAPVVIAPARLDDTQVLDFAGQIHQAYEQKRLDELSLLLAQPAQITWTGMEKKGRVTRQWQNEDYLNHLAAQFAASDELSLALRNQQIKVAEDGQSAQYRVVVTKQAKHSGATRRSVMLEVYNIKLIDNKSKIIDLTISPF